MKLKSINCSKSQAFDISGKTIQTGIFKHPVTGAREVNDYGLVDDTVVNTKVHGGRDQALYLYHWQDYQWWGEQLERELTPGEFGENLTLEGFASNDFSVGDRLLIGEAILEVSAPRIPCSIFAAKMGNPQFLKQFVQASRPGAYARVLRGGSIEAGMAIEYQPCADGHPTVIEIYDQRHAKSPSRHLLERALAAPLSELLRPNLEERLEKLQK